MLKLEYTTLSIRSAKPQPPVASPKREITGVYFTDNKGNRITKAEYNSTIRVVINSIGLVGSKFKMSVLDKDTISNDVLIDAKEYTFTGNSIYVTIPLTATMQETGGDFKYQNLFVDIVVLATSKHLATVPIEVDLKAIEKDLITNITKFVVEKSEVPKTDGKCVCKEYDLIWGDKVSCDFRKKVVEIAKDLWPKNFLEMANNLMAVFEWESGGTFKPDVPNQKKSGATGLIQFMPQRAEEYFGKYTMEIVPNYYKTSDVKLHNLPRVKEFADMTALKQLDYVKRYFEPLRNRKLEFIDFYLQVLFPVSSGKPEHVVFANSKDKLDLSESESLKLKRVDKYAKNSGLDVNNDGKVMKSEIAKSVNKYLILGQSHKSISKCANVKEDPKLTNDKKFVIVLDPGHGIKPGNSGTQARTYKYYSNYEEKITDGKLHNVNDLPQYVLDDPTKFIVSKLSKDWGYDNSNTEGMTTYKIAIKLKEKLESIGHTVYMTRSQVETVYLGDEPNFKFYEGKVSADAAITYRNSFTNAKNADYFIAIHCDGADNLIDKGSHSIYSDATSKQLATDIMSEYNDFITVLKRSPDLRNDLGVLRTSNKAKMKTLVEVGFLTNPNEAKTIINNIDEIAKRLYNGLIINFNKQK